MEVILLAKVDNLGNLGDVVRVKAGYARNYLIPYGKARNATPENLREFAERKAQLEREEAEAIARAEERASRVDGLELTVPVKVSEEGTLFGSVGTAEIVEAIRAACGEEVERSELHLPHGVFRELGEYEISLSFHPGATATVRLNIVAEE